MSNQELQLLIDIQSSNSFDDLKRQVSYQLAAVQMANSNHKPSKSLAELMEAVGKGK